MERGWYGMLAVTESDLLSPRSSIQAETIEKTGTQYRERCRGEPYYRFHTAIQKVISSVKYIAATERSELLKQK